MTKGLSDVPSPLYYRGELYIVRDGGILSSLDPQTGQLRRQIRLNGALDKYFASPVAADGRIYLMGQSGKLVTVRAGIEPALLSVHDLREECYTTPAVAHRSLYVRTREALYRYGARRRSAQRPRSTVIGSMRDARLAGI